MPYDCYHNFSWQVNELSKECIQVLGIGHPSRPDSKSMSRQAGHNLLLNREIWSSCLSLRCNFIYLCICFLCLNGFMWPECMGPWKQKRVSNPLELEFHVVVICLEWEFGIHLQPARRAGSTPQRWANVELFDGTFSIGECEDIRKQYSENTLRDISPYTYP